MGEDRWRGWREAALARHAADMVRVGAWPRDSAGDRAAAEFGLVPDGQGSAGHEFRSIEPRRGHSVGAIWFAPDGHDGAFLWNIVVDPDERGVGYGRAAMEALEPLVQSRAGTPSAYTCSATMRSPDASTARWATSPRP